MTPVQILAVPGVASAAEGIDYMTPYPHCPLITIHVWPWVYFRKRARRRVRAQLAMIMPAIIRFQLRPWWPWSPRPGAYLRGWRAK